MRGRTSTQRHATSLTLDEVIWVQEMFCKRYRARLKASVKGTSVMSSWNTVQAFSDQTVPGAPWEELPTDTFKCFISVGVQTTKSNFLKRRKPAGRWYTNITSLRLITKLLQNIWEQQQINATALLHHSYIKYTCGKNVPRIYSLNTIKSQKIKQQDRGHCLYKLWFVFCVVSFTQLTGFLKMEVNSATSWVRPITEHLCHSEFLRCSESTNSTLNSTLFIEHFKNNHRKHQLQSESTSFRAEF